MSGYGFVGWCNGFIFDSEERSDLRKKKILMLHSI